MTWRSFMIGMAALVGCSSGSDSPTVECVQGLSTKCSPLYAPPVYQTIFDKTLHPTCASGMGTCHTSDAAKGGLVFEDADAAYALLLGKDGSKARVVPGDPACSLLLERLTSSDPNFHMPPGPNSILPGEQCAIVQWIAAGAKR
jgi:hypothetical protein